MIFSFVFPISGTEWKDKESGTKVVQGTKRVLYTYTCFAWAGGTFFPVVLYVVSVFGSDRKKVLVQIRMYYLEYNMLVSTRRDPNYSSHSSLILL